VRETFQQFNIETLKPSTGGFAALSSPFGDKGTIFF
jgi:hypothetical protein